MELINLFYHYLFGVSRKFTKDKGEKKHEQQIKIQRDSDLQCTHDVGRRMEPFGIQELPAEKTAGKQKRKIDLSKYVKFKKKGQLLRPSTYLYMALIHLGAVFKNFVFGE